MKLLHITATHLNPVGGIGIVLRQLVNAQNRIDGLESRVISLKAKVDNIESPYFTFLKIRQLKEYLLTNSPDIVIIHSFFYLQYILVYKELKKQKIPYIIEPHGAFVKEALLKSKIKKLVANNTIFKGLIKNAVAYIYLCEEEMEKSKFHTKYDMIIPNAVEKTDININKRESIKFYYIGRYDIHHKGLDLLLDALSILEKKHVVINIDLFGTGTKKQLKYIEEKIKNMEYVHCNNRGPLIGNIKNKTLAEYNIMILTSRYEGLPMTILEAWNLGIPCIISEGTNMDRDAITNNIGWVSEMTPQEIAKCICNVQEDYKRQKDIYITNCINFIEKKYRWNNIALLSFRYIEHLLKHYGL